MLSEAELSPEMRAQMEESMAHMPTADEIAWAGNAEIRQSSIDPEIAQRFERVTEVIPVGELAVEGNITNEPSDLASMREMVASRLREIVTNPDIDVVNDFINDFILALDEVVTNVIKHAYEDPSDIWGVWRLYLVPDGHVPIAVSFWVQDHGKGIAPTLAENNSFLQDGKTTAPSAGLGSGLILRLTDKYQIATGPGGTTVQITKHLPVIPDA